MACLPYVPAVALGHGDMIALLEEAKPDASRILQPPEGVKPSQLDLRRTARGVGEATAGVGRGLNQHEQGGRRLLVSPPGHVQAAPIARGVVEPDLLGPVLRQQHALHERDDGRIE